jgi:hypothetical protein
MGLFNSTFHDEYSLGSRAVFNPLAIPETIFTAATEADSGRPEKSVTPKAKQRGARWRGFCEH